MKALRRLEIKIYVRVGWEAALGLEGRAVEGLENRLYWPYGTQ